jgi:hypothetical protein
MDMFQTLVQAVMTAATSTSHLFNTPQASQCSHQPHIKLPTTNTTTWLRS